MTPCVGFPGYSITRNGDVFTHRRRFGKGKGNGGGVRIDPDFSRKLNRYVGHGGYWYVSISTPRGQRPIPIHVLMAATFIGPCPDGQEVRHLDGKPKNIELGNLCYGTVKQNAEDRVRCGVQMAGESHPLAKLTWAQVRTIRELRAMGGITARQIAVRFGVSRAAILQICSGRRWAE